MNLEERIEKRLLKLHSELDAIRARARAQAEAKRARSKAKSQHKIYLGRKRRKRQATKDAVKAKWYADRQQGLKRRTERALRERLKPYSKAFSTTTDVLKVIFERLPRAVIGRLIEQRLLTEAQREQAIVSAQRVLPTVGVKPVPARKQIRK